MVLNWFKILVCNRICNKELCSFNAHFSHFFTNLFFDGRKKNERKTIHHREFENKNARALFIMRLYVCKRWLHIIAGIRTFDDGRVNSGISHRRSLKSSGEAARHKIARVYSETIIKPWTSARRIDAIIEWKIPYQQRESRKQLWNF